MSDKNDGGLKQKYFVAKLEGKGMPDFEIHPTTREKHFLGWKKKGWCFVLSPEKNDEYGAASREAMRTYAHKIMKTNRELGRDLLATVNGIETELRRIGD